jgi:hypothetical protein
MSNIDGIVQGQGVWEPPSPPNIGLGLCPFRNFNKLYSVSPTEKKKQFFALVLIPLPFVRNAKNETDTEYVFGWECGDWPLSKKKSYFIFGTE